MVGGPETQMAIRDAFKSISEALLSHHQKHVDRLLERIKGLENDVKRLREGVSNIDTFLFTRPAALSNSEDTVELTTQTGK